MLITKEITKDNLDEINILENLFKNVFDNDKILNRMNVNPFTKYIILLKDNEIIGFINFDIIYDRIELININVLDKYQGNGYSNILMDKMISYDYTNITLEVSSKNIKAINLYKKYGFIEETIRKNYYIDSDAILMKKENRKNDVNE